jgi:hypothetical protein
LWRSWVTDFIEARKECNFIIFDKFTELLSEDESNEIYNLILEKQKGAKLVAYMGCSESRITGERLGNEEYETDEWKWPADFTEHYVLTHKVKPTDEFLKWIGYDIQK